MASVLGALLLTHFDALAGVSRLRSLLDWAGLRYEPWLLLCRVILLWVLGGLALGSWVVVILLLCYCSSCGRVVLVSCRVLCVALSCCAVLCCVCSCGLDAIRPSSSPARLLSRSPSF